MKIVIKLTHRENDISYNNITLSDFNKTKSRKENLKPRKQSTMKFPMPRKIKDNQYPERNMNTMELINEMIDYYDNKQKPEHYEQFVEESISKKSKKSKKANKSKSSPTANEDSKCDNPSPTSQVPDITL